MQADYPERWPTFFQDVLAQLPQGAHVADMFLRILSSVDEDVISLDIPRSEAESRASMAFKDALRERDIVDIVRAWGVLVVTYQDSAPALAAVALATVRRYANWVDIGLVANADFVRLLFDLLARALPPRSATSRCYLSLQMWTCVLCPLTSSCVRCPRTLLLPWIFWVFFHLFRMASDVMDLVNKLIFCWVP